VSVDYSTYEAQPPWDPRCVICIVLPTGTYPHHAATLIGGDAICSSHVAVRARSATLMEALEKAAGR
jgi:hypothetical protein